MTIHSIMLHKRNNHCIHQVISYYTAIMPCIINIFRCSLLCVHRCCSSIWCESLYFLQCYWICSFKLTVGGIVLYMTKHTQLASWLHKYLIFLTYKYLNSYMANFIMVYLNIYIYIGAHS